MKKNQIILALVSIALLLGNPVILAQESEQKEQISKLKEQYNKFKDAFSCVRRRGWRGCDAEKKKKIKQAIGTLIVLVIGAYIGYRGLGWYRKEMQRRMEEETAKINAFLESKGFKSINPESEDDTPLAEAIEVQPEMVSLLIKHGARLDVNFPLNRAVIKGDESIVALLLKEGANVNENFYGKTPLDRANELKEESMKNKIIKALEAYDAKTSADLAAKRKKHSVGKEEQ